MTGYLFLCICVQEQYQQLIYIYVEMTSIGSVHIKCILEPLEGTGVQSEPSEGTGILFKASEGICALGKSQHYTINGRHPAQGGQLQIPDSCAKGYVFHA